MFADQEVDEGVKNQATGVTKISHFIDLAGGGELVDLMKKANRTKNYTELETRIREGLRPYLYNDGEGIMVPISKLVAVRQGKKYVEEEDDKATDTKKTGRWNRLWCCLKSALKSESDNKNNNQTQELKLKDMEALPNDEKKQVKQEKLVVWHLDERGGVGDTPLHMCLLNATSVHADLAKWLLKVYPKLVYDIYLHDEYYGENVLHMAIVNEDPSMVRFLLNHNPDLHQSACGNFFTPDDQKAFRKNLPNQELYELPVKTNYMGYTYWGGYALGFAACLGQEECVRLLVARGADPNLCDANGNTILHLMVIHANRDMFDLLIDLGAKMNVINRQGLTPLTLAAKLASKEMYEHILELDREVYWVYGNVTCAGYPLEFIDTISETGEINTNSAMYHVVYGGERGHLDMIDGIIAQLLEEKWKTFAKTRFFRRFSLFTLYFIIFMVAFYLRPGTDTRPSFVSENRTNSNGSVYTVNITLKDPCYLLRADTAEDMARLTLEAITLIGATWYVFLSLKEVYHQGYKIFFKTLSASPAKALFLMANCFVILMVPGRAACAYTYEDVMGVLAILCTAPYFLFFCRGFKIVGPFVVMIYTMVRTDLIRFFAIYLVFVIGFSQAFFILFISINVDKFSHPFESVMGMFLMSLQDFGDVLDTFDLFKERNLEWLPKVIFVIYMVLVTLLLVNMLIAMMGNTYQVVSETEKEWLRQWAKIILVVEQTVTTDVRREQLISYSRPMDDGRRALVIRSYHSEEEQAEIERDKAAEKKHINMMLRKQREQKEKQKAGPGKTPHDDATNAVASKLQN